jgi:hypothetical protein
VVGKVDLVLLALQLFFEARIGFRAISRVLCVFSDLLELAKTPCPQTVINWVTRLSIVKIEQAAQLSASSEAKAGVGNGFIWVIDTSIGLGAGKIFTVLALDTHHHQRHPHAPTLGNVHCLAVAVANSWTGESVADFLQRLMSSLGSPAAILKDGGTDLGKAQRLLTARGTVCPSIDDMSHHLANLVKHAYRHDPQLAVFISACGKVSKHLKQTVLACLAPPSVSVKARFMNLHRWVSWADKLLKHSPPGRAAQGSRLEKLRLSLDRLPQCKTFIQRFLRDARALLACQKLLKVKGLSHKTYVECEHLLELTPLSPTIRTGFVDWASKQLKIAQTLGVEAIGLPVSSDCVESLFGVGKRLGTGDVNDAHRIAKRLPALCGTLSEEDAQRVLEISVKAQQQTMGSTDSLIQQRRKVLAHPGTLETLEETGEARFELIPSAKNRANNAAMPSVRSDFEISCCPAIREGISGDICAKALE